MVKFEEKKLLNSLKGIKYENDFRYKIILENENQKDGRILTSEVNIYIIHSILENVANIIDTSGFWRYNRFRFYNKCYDYRHFYK